MPVVTLTNNNTNYSLLTLLYGASGVVGTNLNTQGKENCAQLNLRSDPGNSASKIWIGDGTVSSTVYDAVLDAAGVSFTFGNAVDNTISLVNKFLRTDTGGVKVDVSTVYR
jgi:hypothetical protein